MMNWYGAVENSTFLFVVACIMVMVGFAAAVSQAGIFLEYRRLHAAGSVRRRNRGACEVSGVRLLGTIVFLTKSALTEPIPKSSSVKFNEARLFSVLLSPLCMTEGIRDAVRPGS